MRVGSVSTAMGMWMGTGSGVTPPAPLAVPYLAWEVSQQLLDTRVLCQRGALGQPLPGLAAPGPQPDPSGGTQRVPGGTCIATRWGRGTAPSPVAVAWARLALWPSVPAQQRHSLGIAPWEQGRWQTGWGTRHGASVGWDRTVRPGGDRSDPQTPFPFQCSASTPLLLLLLLLPAAQPWGAPLRDQHHSPSPPTPSPPTPRPPTRRSPGEHQQGQQWGSV